MIQDIKITAEIIGQSLHGMVSIHTGEVLYPEADEVVYEVECSGNPKEHRYNLAAMRDMFDMPFSRLFPIKKVALKSFLER